LTSNLEVQTVTGEVDWLERPNDKALKSRDREESVDTDTRGSIWEEREEWKRLSFLFR
jgi:hypothetical protein